MLMYSRSSKNFKTTSHNTYYIGCVSYRIKATKTHEAGLPQLLMSTAQTQMMMILVGLRWNGHHWSFFHMCFHRQMRCSKLYTHVCYVWIWTIQRRNLSSRISRSKFKFSNIVSKSNHAPLAGRGRVWGLRLTMLPLSTQSHIIALLPSNEKSFTLYDGFGKSALLWNFEPRDISGEKFLMGWLLCFKRVSL